MQGVVRRVEIEDDLFRRLLVRFEKDVDQQALDRRRVVRDLTVPRRGLARQFQTVQRGFAGDRSAIRAPRFELAGQHRHHRIVAQVVVVVEILIAEREAEHALANQRGHSMLNKPGIAHVAKAAGQATNEIDRLVGRPQEQPARVRRHRPAVEFGDHRPPLNRCKLARLRATLRLHRGPSPHPRKYLSQNNLSLIRSLDALPTLRNPG